MRLQVALLVLVAACSLRGSGGADAVDPDDPGAADAAADQLDAAVVARLGDLDAARKAVTRGAPLAQTRVAMPADPRAKPAPVVVTYVYELACKYCGAARAILAELRARYGDRVAIVRRAFLVHRVPAMAAHLVACAAERRGVRPAVEDAIFDRALPAADYTSANLLEVAAAAGVAHADVVAAARTAACFTAIRDDHLLAVRAGVRGTPTFFVNGIPVEGLARGISDLTAPIDAELARADAHLAAGGDLAGFHAAWQREALQP